MSGYRFVSEPLHRLQILRVDAFTEGLVGAGEGPLSKAVDPLQLPGPGDLSASHVPLPTADMRGRLPQAQAFLALARGLFRLLYLGGIEVVADDTEPAVRELRAL
jgi:hypothetical protein